MPAVGASMPWMMRSSVVLPAPLGPTMTQNSPLEISKERLRSTSTDCVVPSGPGLVNVSERLSTSISAMRLARGWYLLRCWVVAPTQSGDESIDVVHHDELVEVDRLCLGLRLQSEVLHVGDAFRLELSVDRPDTPLHVKVINLAQ